MFNSIDELIKSRFHRSQFQLRRAALLRWASGIAGAAAGFQVLQTLIAFE